ncbi:hypothetical protein [Nitrospira sp. Ecomares 2.1]
MPHPAGAKVNEISAFVLEYGGIVLFSIVSGEQIGLPIPAIPVMLAAVALACMAWSGVCPE